MAQMHRLILCLAILSFGRIASCGRCQERTLLKESDVGRNGTLTDFAGTYGPLMECEWLIQASSPNATITLTFSEYATECQYDYVFVYDGLTYDSPLLAALSGVAKVDPVVATSGSMLVFFYSDTNYVLEGFVGSYVIEYCPSNCSGHGRCVYGQCNCDVGYRGVGCEADWCPDQCSGHGVCSMDQRRCLCENGYHGPSCALEVLDDTWVTLAPTGSTFPERFEHTSLYDQERDQIITFGGTSLSKKFNDIHTYNFQTSKWTKVEVVGVEPSVRSSHAAVFHNSKMYVFGGELTDSQPSHELWSFDVNTNGWTLLPSNEDCSYVCPQGNLNHTDCLVSTTQCVMEMQNVTNLQVVNGTQMNITSLEEVNVCHNHTMASPALLSCNFTAPPPLSGHVGCLADGRFIIIGGRSDRLEFQSQVYEYDIDQHRWYKYKPNRIKFSQVIGHSAVFEETSRSIYVFGGFRPVHARYGSRSDDIFAYNVDTHIWLEIPESGDGPPNIAFHSASLVGDLMVVYGGGGHQHYVDEECFHPAIYAYSFSCNSWTPKRVDDSNAIGRSSHTAISREGSIVVVGGFDGLAKGDLISYTPSDGWCRVHETEGTCNTSPTCGSCKPHQFPALDLFRRHPDRTLDILPQTRNRGFNVLTLTNVTAATCASRCTDPCRLFEFIGENDTPFGDCVLHNVDLDCLANAGARVTSSDVIGTNTSILFERYSDDERKCPDYELQLVCEELNVTCSDPHAECTQWLPDSRGDSEFACGCLPFYFRNSSDACQRCSAFGCLTCTEDQCTECATGLFLYLNEAQSRCVNSSTCEQLGYFGSMDGKCSPQSDETNEICFASRFDAISYHHNDSFDLLQSIPRKSITVETTEFDLYDIPFLLTDGNRERSNATCVLASGSEPQFTIDMGWQQPIAIVRLYLHGIPCTASSLDCELRVTVADSSFATQECVVQEVNTNIIEAMCNTEALLINITASSLDDKLQANIDLNVCEIEVFSPATPVQVEDLDGAACGAGEDAGVWVSGQCDSHCQDFTNCDTCAGHVLCEWCPLTSTCEALGNNPSNCSNSVETPEQCRNVAHDQGLTVEYYYTINTGWSASGLRRSTHFQNHNPDEVHVIEERFTSLFPSGRSHGERVHGFFKVPQNGTYYLWVKTTQGLAIELYFGNSAVENSLVASARDGPRPQQRWDMNPEQHSQPVILVSEKWYYISAITFIYDPNFFGANSIDVALTSTDTTLPTNEDIIPGNWLRQYYTTEEHGGCSSINNCHGCSAANNCGWCGTECVSVQSQEGQQCDLLVTDDSQCKACGDNTGCSDCMTGPGCEWIYYLCRKASGHRDAIVSIAGTDSTVEPTCPALCSELNDCRSCATSTSCAWCSSTNSCFEFSGYNSRFANGQCLAWEVDPAKCLACSTFTDCGSCSRERECGWCYSEDDPTKGYCTEGDFDSPVTTCSLPSESSHPVLWEYGRCPPVDECRLGYDNCAQNATCIETAESFDCECNSGYFGEGTSCAPICSSCVNGICEAPEVCRCNEGWIGANCTNCLRSDVHSGLFSVSETSVIDFCPPFSTCLPEVWNATEPFRVLPNTTYDNMFTCQCVDGYEKNHLSGLCDPVCTPSCAQGTCIAPGTCDCDNGWTGDLCDMCIPTFYGCQPNSECGLYNGTVECSCLPGYIGDSCEPYCADRCVFGNCEAPDECGCDFGFLGPLCDQCGPEIAPTLCHEYATCTAAFVNTTTANVTVELKQVSCECLPGYEGNGTNCQPVCSLGCGDGYCIAPDVCQCNRGANGTRCDECAVENSCSAFGICGKNATKLFGDRENYNHSSTSIQSTNGPRIVPPYNTTVDPNTNLTYSYFSAGNYYCACQPGYAGDGIDCEPVCTQPCLSGDCIFDELGSGEWGRCDCFEGFLGDSCEFCVVSNDSCTANSTCIPIDDGSALGVCTCDNGFEGDGISECKPVCPGCINGNCIAPNVCVCHDPWGGRNCTECAQNPCSDNATCAVHVNSTGVASTVCTCLDGYEGDGITCTPVCDVPCLFGECIAPNVCECARHWLGPDCSNCDPSDSQCGGQAVCLPVGTSTQCVCEPGYDGDPLSNCEPQCDPVCALGNCTSPNVCTCEPGWEGLSCDSCITDGPFRPCHINATCEYDETGGSACTCNSGYFGNGIHCTPICESGCVHGECIAPNVCQCEAGWSNSFAANCTDCNPDVRVDGVISSVCSSNAQCVEQDTGARQCVCNEGYEGDGDLLGCNATCTQTCEPKGMCYQPDVCLCFPGWGGINCTECPLENLCSMNATCIKGQYVNRTFVDELDGGYSCECKEGYEGDGLTCTPICSQGCVHGSCTDIDVCECDLSTFIPGPAWTGQNCTTCVQGAHSCHLNATCASENGSLQCECKDGYTGDGFNCEPVCDLVDCGVNGQCVAPNQCRCNLGYYGDECELDCGCNFHSTCLQGPGVCDQCTGNTMGSLCDQCQPDYFGDPSIGSCDPCPCNLHGSCNNITGVCTCDQYTEGPNCNLCKPGYVGNPADGGMCYRACEGQVNRIQLGDGWGAIGSGNGPCDALDELDECYKHAAGCAFYISPSKDDQANDVSRRSVIDRSTVISLSFDLFDTECMYDYVQVYDGPSFDSPLLGAFSGDQIPQAIHAYSGSLLVYWYTDANWAEGGFKAQYIVHDCSNGCSVHGECLNGTCVCKQGWVGIDCSLPTCPSNCHESLNQGVCNIQGGFCECHDGFTGTDCSVKTKFGDPYFTPGPTLPAGRSRHSVVALNGSLWLFGGVVQETFPHGTNSLVRLDLGHSEEVNSEWSAVPIRENWPLGRYGHSAVGHIASGAMFVHGGILLNQRIPTAETWSFSITSWSWGMLQPAPSPRWGHTATLVGDEIIVIGGLNEQSEIASNVEVYSILSDSWKVASTTSSSGGSVYGHTAVYSEVANCIVVYGGRGRIRQTNGYYNNKYWFSYHMTDERQDIYLLDVSSFEWRAGTAANATSFATSPARYLHSAEMFGNFMLVFGGSPFSHRGEQRCHDNSVGIYNVICDQWMDASSSFIEVSVATAKEGFVEAATTSITTSNQTTIWITGGFNGALSSSVLTWHLPSKLMPCDAQEVGCLQMAGCGLCSNASTNEVSCRAISFDETPETCVGQVAPSDAAMCPVIPCDSFLSCAQCASRGCAWERISSVEGKCHARNDSPGDYIISSGLCDECGDISSCGTCAGTVNSEGQRCGWYQNQHFSHNFCLTEQVSILHNAFLVRYAPQTCPINCAAQTSCATCPTTHCKWCAGTQTCVAISQYMAHAAIGQCQLQQTGQTSCLADCSIHTSCGQCITSEGCGWCDSATGPRCLSGDGSGSFQPDLCPSPYLPEQPTNSSTEEWHYFQCKDVDECSRGLDDCSANATCTNLVVTLLPGESTKDSYECTCKYGYQGDGFTCNPVCETYGCVHGTCIAPDVCDCDIGFSGDDCNSDCLCNRHSFCTSGKCDRCEHNTEGENCERCTPGFYGNATIGNADDCIPCLEACNNHTSTCVSSIEYTIDGAVCQNCAEESHSTGTFCDSCLPGFYRTISSSESSTELVEQRKGQEWVICAPCQCQGRGNTCNPETGLHCVCDPETHSYTLTPERQCASCKTGFVSSSVPLSLCYLAGTVDTLYVLNVHEASYVQGIAILNSPVISVRVNIDTQVPIFLRVAQSSDIYDDDERAIKVKTLEIPEGVTKVELSCTEFDLLSGDVFMSFESKRGSGPVSVTVESMNEDDPTCATCASTDAGCIPCIPGYFRSPYLQHRCIPCQCNGHGDICDSETGVDCQVFSSASSSRSPTCRGNTISCPTECQPLNPAQNCRTSCLVVADYSSQCNWCAEGYYGIPLGGQQCYSPVPFTDVVEEEIAMNDAKFYVISPDQYTNIDLRIVVDVWEGLVEAHIASDIDMTFDYTTGKLTSSAKHIASDLVQDRKVFYISQKVFANLRQPFYLAVVGQKDSKFKVYSEQTLIQIDLFVFFSVFFSSFFLTLSLVVIYAKSKAAYRRWNLHQQRQQELELLAHRPVGKVIALLRSDIPSEAKQVLSFNTYPIPKRSRKWLVPTAVTEQPCASGNASVCSFLVELPDSKTLCIGSTLISKRVTKGRKRRRKPSTSGSIHISAV